MHIQIGSIGNHGRGSTGPVNISIEDGHATDHGSAVDPITGHVYNNQNVEGWPTPAPETAALLEAEPRQGAFGRFLGILGRRGTAEAVIAPEVQQIAEESHVVDVVQDLPGVRNSFMSDSGYPIEVHQLGATHLGSIDVHNTSQGQGTVVQGGDIIGDVSI